MLAGALPEPEAERLERHLDRCPVCTAEARRLQVRDTLLDSVRRAGTLPGAEVDGPEVEPLIEQLIALRPGATPDSGGAPSRPGGDAVEELRALLEPAGEAGGLGRLGGYRLIEVLGMGGMGVVLRAEDPQLRRVVALKVMKPVLAAGAANRQRFLREAQATAGLEHDHVAAVYQVGEDRGLPFLAMQLLHGETLAQRLEREGRLPVAEVVRIGREVTEGLAAAHAKGLIHRDVKPGNIWLQAGSGRVKVLDFGLARAADDATPLTQTGTVVGTPAYMAPEQARGEPVDARCDLFSLGCVLYQMATGELPFRGRNATALLHALAVDRPRPPRQLNPDVPQALSDLVLRLLVKDPAGRPASAQEVSAALAAIAAPAPPRPPRRRGRLLAAVAVLALALGLASYWYGATLLRVITNKGQLVIETSDPDVEVIVRRDGQQIHIQDRKSHQQIDLEAGAWQIRLSGGKDGLTLSTDHFTLKRGGREIVRVSRESAPQPPKPAALPGEAAKDLELVRDLDFSHGCPLAQFDHSAVGGLLTEYRDGEYRVVSPLGVLHSLEDLVPAIGDFVCEVRGRLAASGEGGGWALCFGHRWLPEDKSFASVEVAGDGRVRVGRWHEGAERVLLPWTAVPALRPGADPSTIRLEVIAKRVRLLVNGRLVGERLDEDYLPGAVNLGVEAGRSPVDVRFRSVRLWRAAPNGTPRTAAPDYHADFNHPVAEFPESGENRSGYERKVYFIRADKGQSEAVGGCPGKPVGAFVAEVSGRVADGPGGHWALVIGAGRRVGTWIEVRDDGYYRVRHVDDDQSHLLLAPYVIGPAPGPGWYHHDALRQQGAFNRLSVAVRDRWITLSFNDKWACDVADPGYGAGLVRLGAGAGAEPTRAEFQSLRLWTGPSAHAGPEQPEILHALRCFTGHGSQVNSVALSPDGKLAL
jgi:serine/threonine protein kinase